MAAVGYTFTQATLCQGIDPIISRQNWTFMKLQQAKLEVYQCKLQELTRI